MFAAEFETVDGQRRRREPRATSTLDAELAGAGRAICRVLIYSTRGARLQTYTGLERGAISGLRCQASAAARRASYRCAISRSNRVPGTAWFQGHAGVSGTMRARRASQTSFTLRQAAHYGMIIASLAGER